jgi:hypothetical protein
MRFIVLGSLVLALVPASGSAQSASHATTAAFAAPVAPSAAIQQHKGPTIESAAVGVRSAATKLDASAPRSRSRSSGIGHPAALIVVGGGAMVAGTFMDGEPATFFLVGGALIALWGLYQLVQ